MRVIDVRPDPADEFVVATGECRECGEALDRRCIPIEVDDATFPPQYLWRHRDGVVICGWDGVPQVATPLEGTVTDV